MSVFGYRCLVSLQDASLELSSLLGDANSMQQDLLGQGKKLEWLGLSMPMAHSPEQ